MAELSITVDNCKFPSEISLIQRLNRGGTASHQQLLVHGSTLLTSHIALREISWDRRLCDSIERRLRQ